MVKDHSDSGRENPLPPHRLLFPISSNGSFICTHRQDSTYHGLCYTSRGALAGTINSSMCPTHEGSIRQPIAPWANALTTELHLAPSVSRWTWQTFKTWLTVVSAVRLGSWCGGMSEISFVVDPLRYFSFQSVLHDWCNKGCGMCYPVYGMVHIRDHLLLLRKSSPWGDNSCFSITIWGS